ncbi:hypothetical protein CANARDRAFT_177793 [[Candida] arabinofermentans NRRL YB-2248]|uniref:PQ-loop-domain-containing protein n=1 Tax=[Candida] arabinofermentans NRRL YB-2248 TaxID=983967 RepID=A0A1E4SUZ6_9ASCO|nr:hypothetical protein CANARDRAFT_177793 [[Candida] arabinofermentans NRRL YB-2248]
MTNVNTIANVLSTIGTVLWCVQLSPQIYFLWKRKDATGFPPIFMFLWCASGSPFGVYFIVSDSYLPMQIQPQLFMFLCSIAWIQAMYYPPYSIPKKRIFLYAFLFYSISLAIELGFGIPLKKVYKDGTTWPSLVFGIIASIVLAAGLLPPYFELSKRQGRVVGINFIFLMMDTAGAVFSMASQLIGDIDVMGMILYAVIIVMECGLYCSQIIWYIRFRVLRKERLEDEEGTSDDNINEADKDMISENNEDQFIRILRD